MRNSFLFGVLMLMVTGFFPACADRRVKEKTSGSRSNTASVLMEYWGEHDGRPVHLFTLSNRKGTEIRITNYGGIITSWTANDKQGNRSNIVVGFDSLAAYLRRPPLFGAVVGRYANRMGNASFLLDGVTYKLTANNGKNQLHGGAKGFDKVVWDAAPATGGSGAVTMTYLSKDGEEGYPGNLLTTVIYTLTEEDELRIEYKATTDKATPVNFTNHSYFNLGGDVNKTVLDHLLWIDADQYTPMDDGLIPTGVLAPVEGTPLDFTRPRPVGERLSELKNGYDHNFVLKGGTSALRLVASLSEGSTGRTLEVHTTEPGLQLYTGNALNGRFRNRDGKPVNRQTAICLETQHYPDSPNKPHFPNTILRPGETFSSVTVYKLLVR